MNASFIHFIVYILVLLVEITMVNIFHRYLHILPLQVHNYLYKYMYSIHSNFQLLSFLISRILHSVIDIYILYTNGISNIVSLTGNDIHYISIILYIVLTNNTLFSFLNISDNMRYYLHFYYGIYFYILCFIHCIVYIIPFNTNLYFKQQYSFSIIYFPITRAFGSLAFLILTCIICCLYIKNKQYEVFKSIHVILVVLFLLLTSFHRNTYIITSIIFLSLYIVNKCLLLLRSNKVKLYPQINIYSSMYIKLYYETKKKCCKNYLYLCIPSISYFQWHPFSTIYEDDNKGSIIIKNNGNYTNTINTIFMYNKHIEAFISGPFNQLQIQSNADHYIFISNGVGIIPFLNIFHIFYATNYNAYNDKNIYIIWIIQDISIYYYIKPYLQKLQTYITSLNIKIYLKTLHIINEPFIICIYERLNISNILNEIYETIIETGNEHICIYTCVLPSIHTEIYTHLYTKIIQKYPCTRNNIYNELCTY